MIKLIDLIQTLSNIDARMENEATNEFRLYDVEEFRVYINTTLIWSSGSIPPGYMGQNATGRKMFRDLMLKSPKYIKWHESLLNEHHIKISRLIKMQVKDIKVECILDKQRVNSYFNTDVRPKHCIIKILLK